MLAKVLGRHRMNQITRMGNARTRKVNLSTPVRFASRPAVRWPLRNNSHIVQWTMTMMAVNNTTPKWARRMIRSLSIAEVSGDNMVECQIGSVAVLRCCEKKWEK